MTYLNYWPLFHSCSIEWSHGLCCCTWGTEISVIFSGNWTFSISWLVTGMFSFVISGNTFMSKADIRVTIPAKALTANEEWRSFSSPIWQYGLLSFQERDTKINRFQDEMSIKKIIKIVKQGRFLLLRSKTYLCNYSFSQK